ncbi:MAG: glycerate-2-kinase family protein, partial [Bacteroidota bacterium]
AVEAAVEGLDPTSVRIGERVISALERLRVVAIGKAASTMAAALSGRLPESLFHGDGIVVANRENARPVEGFRLFASGHPLPDAVGVDGAGAIEEYVRGASARDALLVLLSGGGSAILPAPAPPISLEEKIALTDALLKAGADIWELNTVRKHVSRLKGGGLARAAAPATVHTLIVSDVIGTLTSDKSIDNLDITYNAFMSAVDWPKAEILCCGQIGAISSGLDPTTNSTYKILSGLAAYFNQQSDSPAPDFKGFDYMHCMFAPFVDPKYWAEDTDINTSLTYFKNSFNNLNNRVNISADMFEALRIEGKTTTERLAELYTEFPSIESMVPIQQNDTNMELSLIDSLTRRMAFCMIDYRDTLSDCVTTYMLDAWNAAGNDLSKTYLPGLQLDYSL